MGGSKETTLSLKTEKLLADLKEMTGLPEEAIKEEFGQLFEKLAGNEDQEISVDDFRAVALAYLEQLNSHIQNEKH